MLNIVHFGKYYYPDSGGIESVTKGLAEGAAVAGHSVTVVCFGRGSRNEKIAINGVNVIRTSMLKLLASQPFGFGYLFMCHKAAKKANIIHLHAPNMLAALCALFIKKNTTLLVHWHSDVINKRLLGKLMIPLEFALLRRANVIVAATKEYAAASKTISAFKSKTKVISYGVPDRSLLSNDQILPKQILEVVRGRKIILSVGRLVPYKGFEVLVEAASQLSKDSVVLIVGAGPLENQLQQQIDDAQLNDSVKLLGRVDDAVLDVLYKEAALYCLPSLYRSEAFGVVLIEAMAYGVPVVATEIHGSGVPWVNKHGVSGLNVPVGDPLALADTCNKILNTDELRNELSSGARSRFLSEFTEETSIKRIMSLYDQLFDAKAT